MNADNYQHFNTNSKGFLSYSYDNNNNANMQVHFFFILTSFLNIQRICAFAAMPLLCIAITMIFLPFFLPAGRSMRSLHA